MKYLIPVLCVLLIIALCVSMYKLGKIKAEKPNTNETTIRTTIPEKTIVIRERIPAKIDTAYVDGHQYDMASYSDVVDTNKVYVKTDIEYDEYHNLFSVRHDIMALRDSTYIEKITQLPGEKYKPKFIGLTGGITTGFANTDKGLTLHSSGIDAGIKLLGKYSATLFANTDEVYGLRFGVDF